MGDEFCSSQELSPCLSEEEFFLQNLTVLNSISSQYDIKYLFTTATSPLSFCTGLYNNCDLITIIIGIPPSKKL